MNSAQQAPSARSVFRSLAQGTGLYVAALIAQRIGGFVTLPLITHNLSPSEYGIAGVLEQISAVLSLILGSGYAWSLGYFYSGAETDTDRRRILGTCVGGSAILGVAAAGITWPFLHFISHLVFGTDIAAGYLRVTVIGLVAGFVLESLYSWLRVTNKEGAYLWGSVLRLLLTIGGLFLLLVAVNLRVWGMLFASLIAAAVSGIALLIYLLRVARPLFDKAVFIRMLRFSLPVGVGSLASFVINFGDQLILPRYTSTAQVGVYLLAYKIAMLSYTFIYSPFQMYWGAQCFTVLKREDGDVMFARIFTYVTTALSFCAIGVLSVAGLAMRIFPATYTGAVGIIPIIIAAYFIRAVGDFARSLLWVAGKPGYDAATNWIGCVVCLGGYFTLIPRWGSWGAAIATLLSFSVVAIVALVVSYRIKPYHVEAGRLMKVAAACAVSLVIYSALKGPSIAQQILSAGAVMVSFVAVLLLSGFSTPGERQVVSDAFRRLAVSRAG